MKYLILIGAMVLAIKVFAQAEVSGPVILILGDSLTDGFVLGKDRAYPALLQKKIVEDGLEFSVVNAGRSGDTAADGLARLSKYLNLEVAVFMVALGTNDLFRGVDPEKTKKELNSIVQMVKSRHPRAKVIIAGIKQIPGFEGARAEQLEKVFREVAAENSATLVPSLLEGVAGVQTLNIEDGIHPNVAGQERISGTVWEYLRPLLFQIRVPSH